MLRIFSDLKDTSTNSVKLHRACIVVYCWQIDLSKMVSRTFGPSQKFWLGIEDELGNMFDIDQMTPPSHPPPSLHLQYHGYKYRLRNTPSQPYTLLTTTTSSWQPFATVPSESIYYSNNSNPINTVRLWLFGSLACVRVLLLSLFEGQRLLYLFAEEHYCLYAGVIIVFVNASIL